MRVFALWFLYHQCERGYSQRKEKGNREPLASLEGVFALPPPHKWASLCGERPNPAPRLRRRRVGSAPYSPAKRKKTDHLKVVGFLWLGNRDSNPNKQSQSLSCYRYTIPLYWSRIADDSVIIADVFWFVNIVFCIFLKNIQKTAKSFLLRQIALHQICKRGP